MVVTSRDDITWAWGLGFREYSEFNVCGGHLICLYTSSIATKALVIWVLSLRKRPRYFGDHSDFDICGGHLICLYTRSIATEALVIHGRTRCMGYQPDYG